MRLLPGLWCGSELHFSWHYSQFKDAAGLSNTDEHDALFCLVSFFKHWIKKTELAWHRDQIQLTSSVNQLSDKLCRHSLHRGLVILTSPQVTSDTPNTANTTERLCCRPQGQFKMLMEHRWRNHNIVANAPDVQMFSHGLYGVPEFTKLYTHSHGVYAPL